MLKNIRSIEQQIADLKPDVDGSFQLLWEEMVDDGIPIGRAARMMRVTHTEAAYEMGLASGRRKNAKTLAAKAYPYDSFCVHGLDGVPRREYVPELAERVGV